MGTEAEKVNSQYDLEITQLQNKFSLLKYEAHMNAKTKGFWDDRKTNKEKKDEMLAMTVSESAELLESIRKNKTSIDEQNMEQFKQIINGNVEITIGSVQSTEFKSSYECFVKGTIHEELADIVIGLFDYTEGWNLSPYFVAKYCVLEMQNTYEIKPASFVFFLMRTITDVKFNSFPSENIGVAIGKCFMMAKHYGVDLWFHIDLKMKYNSLREFKHGKKL